MRSIDVAKAEHVAQLVGDDGQQVHALGGRATSCGRQVTAGGSELGVVTGTGIDEPAMSGGSGVDGDRRPRRLGESIAREVGDGESHTGEGLPGPVRHRRPGHTVNVGRGDSGLGTYGCGGRAGCPDLLDIFRANSPSEEESRRGRRHDEHDGQQGLRYPSPRARCHGRRRSTGAVAPTCTYVPPPMPCKGFPSLATRNHSK